MRAAPIWLTDADGAPLPGPLRFRRTLILAAGAETLAGGEAGWRRRPGSPSSSVCCCAASGPRRAGTCTGNGTTSSRACACTRRRGRRGAAIDGALYRGIFLRQSREGTLTLPLTPPIALPLPFDIGVLARSGTCTARCGPRPGGPPVDAGVVHGEVLADFWRSRQPGRWLTVGVGGRYEIGLQRDAADVLRRIIASRR